MMINKIFKILVIIFMVIPWTILGLIGFVLSLLRLDPFGTVVGAAILLAQFLTVKGLTRKRVATAETTKEQIVETLQPASASTSDVVFCNRCGGAMDASCKYCRDCGAPLKVNEIRVLRWTIQKLVNDNVEHGCS